MTTPSPSTTFSFGHGLGATPEFAIFKFTNNSSNWYTYHKSLGQKYILLSSQGQQQTAEFTTAPTSTLFTYPNSLIIGPTEPLVSYLFAPVSNYSSFGTYAGNSSSDGPFIYTGFRPKWIMVKPYNGTYSWGIFDAARNTSNVVDYVTYANSALGGQTYDALTFSHPFDFLSNGFKIRYADTGGYWNYSTWDYIYAAFAESPFQYARAR